MNGHGSDQAEHRARTKVEDCTVFDIGAIRRLGLLRERAVGRGNLRCIHCYSGELQYVCNVEANTVADPPYIQVRARRASTGEELEWRIGLEASPCNFGGVRYWFVCSMRECEPYRHRVTKLYLPPGSLSLACWSCHNLIYESSLEGGKRWRWLAEHVKTVLKL
jgi:hypothetical protein